MRCVVFALLISVSTIINAHKTPYQAVVHVPVADLTGQSILDFKLAPTVYESYAKLPLASADTTSVCPRMHQALFNEIVTVLEERGEELCITLPQVIYSTARDATEKNIFWISKKNVTPLDILQSNNLSTAHLPQPIDASKKNIIAANKDVVTLWLPFKSPATGKIFSAGTRFVQASYKRAKDLVFKVYEYDPTQHSMHIIKIPKKYCFQTGNPYTSQERIAAFVGLLKAWAHLSTVVPSVQGGCSFAKECESDTYRVIHTRLTDGHVTSYWERPEMRAMVQSGFDISGVVHRAALICGIPFPHKNTITAARNLQTKQSVHSLVEGDIIWVPGGLYVITDLEKNLVIACCGYDPGYGRLVELPLNKVFNTITTFTELMAALRNKKKFELLTARGDISRTVQECGVLSLQSAWDF